MPYNQPSDRTKIAEVAGMMKRASRNAVSAVTERSHLTMVLIRVAGTRRAMARAFADVAA